MARLTPHMLIMREAAASGRLKCPHCWGSGIDAVGEKCPECFGRGHEPRKREAGRRALEDHNG